MKVVCFAVERLKVLVAKHGARLGADVLGAAPSSTQTLAVTLSAFRSSMLPFRKLTLHSKLECGPMPNVMAALPHIGGALCSTPQSLADAHY